MLDEMDLKRRPEPSKRGVPPVESVKRALRILGCFGLDRPKLGISDIARELAMHKSTVHRILSTLELEGFVHQVDGNRYALSWKVFELGAAVPEWQAIRNKVLRTLESLAAGTGETAHLAVLEEGQVLYLEKVEGSHQLRMPSAVGRRVPVHCTALGKVLIANFDDEELNSLIGKKKLPTFTLGTITNPRTLRSELKSVRAEGYAVDHEEIEEGLMCVAAPVLDEEGVTCAAISIAGPSTRISARLQNHAQAVGDACSSLSTQLGANARRLREACTQVPIRDYERQIAAG